MLEGTRGADAPDSQRRTVGSAALDQRPEVRMRSGVGDHVHHRLDRCGLDLIHCVAKDD